MVAMVSGVGRLGTQMTALATKCNHHDVSVLKIECKCILVAHLGVLRGDNVLFRFPFDRSNTSAAFFRVN